MSACSPEELMTALDKIVKDLLKKYDSGDYKKDEDWIYVSREEMLEFINHYPYPLETDFFMDWYTWNDFRDGRKWPESVVVMAHEMYDNNIYKIRGIYL